MLELIFFIGDSLSLIILLVAIMAGAVMMFEWIGNRIGLPYPRSDYISFVSILSIVYSLFYLIS